jgi:hypothetical protein
MYTIEGMKFVKIVASGENQSCYYFSVIQALISLEQIKKDALKNKEHPYKYLSKKVRDFRLECAKWIVAPGATIELLDAHPRNKVDVLLQITRSPDVVEIKPIKTLFRVVTPEYQVDTDFSNTLLQHLENNSPSSKVNSFLSPYIWSNSLALTLENLKQVYSEDLLTLEDSRNNIVEVALAMGFAEHNNRAALSYIKTVERSAMVIEKEFVGLNVKEVKLATKLWSYSQLGVRPELRLVDPDFEKIADTVESYIKARIKLLIKFRTELGQSREYGNYPVASLAHCHPWTLITQSINPVTQKRYTSSEVEALKTTDLRKYLTSNSEILALPPNINLFTAGRGIFISKIDAMLNTDTGKYTFTSFLQQIAGLKPGDSDASENNIMALMPYIIKTNIYIVDFSAGKLKVVNLYMCDDGSAQNIIINHSNNHFDTIALVEETKQVTLFNSNHPLIVKLATMAHHN